MEEEQGEDSEVLDAMDGWDSEEETAAASTATGDNKGDVDKGAAATDTDKKWILLTTLSNCELL